MQKFLKRGLCEELLMCLVLLLACLRLLFSYPHSEILFFNIAKQSSIIFSRYLRLSRVWPRLRETRWSLATMAIGCRRTWRSAYFSRRKTMSTPWRMRRWWKKQEKKSHRQLCFRRQNLLEGCARSMTGWMDYRICRINGTTKQGYLLILVKALLSQNAPLTPSPVLSQLPLWTGKGIVSNSIPI